jgi:hypothetical protein
VRLVVVCELMEVDPRLLFVFLDCASSVHAR